MPATEKQTTDRAPIKLRPTQFKQLRELIYDTTGIALADNKRDFVQSRLSKRLRALHIDSFEDYYDLLKSGPVDSDEMQQMINRVTTNKTHFFRELHHFEHLRNEVIPRLTKAAARGERKTKFRLWCAAASTGEEPYTLAMTVRDGFADWPGWDIRLLASDIDTEVLKKAEQATYLAHQVEEIPKETLAKHFTEAKGSEEGAVKVRPETADLVTFRQVNLLSPSWPIHTKFDVIFCRNVLIYFDGPTQAKLMRQMAKFLAPDGFLYIGHSESLANLSDTFVRVGKTLYQHAATQNQGTATEPPPKLTMRQPAPPPPRPLPAKKKKKKRKWIVVGDVEASAKPQEITTVLGSCIAVCLFDESSGIGGMNHFALPSGNGSRCSASFGVHAMELLINEIMQLGGDRRRLQAKVFGGANVIGVSEGNKIGDRNASFIHEFLDTESIPITSECLGGDRGMQVLFETHTGRARVKYLGASHAIDAEMEKSKPAAPAEPTSDITLF